MSLKPTSLLTSIKQYFKRKKMHCVALGTIFLLCNNDSYAVVNTQLWLESHRGYSIEQVPGTGVNGVALEYVAAGTAYIPGFLQPGWHFMRLDEFGNVLATRIAYCTSSSEEFRVVDIAVESATKFWITIQARHTTGPGQYDYIYIAGVDQNGYDLTSNPSIVIKTSAAYSYNKELYPTHSLYMGGSLYICGYATDNTFYPSQPTQLYTPKAGVFLKCDVNNSPVTTTSLFWDSYNSFPGPGDYDMPLRISPSRSGNNPAGGFPLLVTGAVNVGDGNISGILAMKFNSNATLITANGYLPSLYAMSYDPPKVTGVYGVDIRGQLYSSDQDHDDQGYCILANYFDETDPLKRTWGVLRVKDNLDVYPITNSSYLAVNDAKSWANQFGELYFADKSLDNDVSILGQQYELYSPSESGSGSCDNLSAPNLVPSFSNINPFIASLKVNGTGFWDYTNGWGGTYPTSGFQPNVVHLSSKGTVSTDMNYLTGSLGSGSALEDISRLYTFGAFSHNYLDANNVSTFKFPGMVAPVGDATGSPSAHQFLSTKLIKTDVMQESRCHNFYNDCPTLQTSMTTSNDPFAIMDTEVETTNGYYLFSLLDTYNMPTQLDCSTGYYKTTGIATTGNNKEFSFYPNPASKEINISLPQSVTSADKIEFILTDITGKTVYNNNSHEQSGFSIKYQLPNLAAGTYMGTINLNGTKYSNKVIIK